MKTYLTGTHVKHLLYQDASTSYPYFLAKIRKYLSGTLLSYNYYLVYCGGSVFFFVMYSCLLLSRLRLSRITACLEVKMWSLPKHKNLTTGKKILWKRGEISSFS